MELSAVVEGDCLESGWVFSDDCQGGRCHGVCCSRFQLSDDSQAGLSFNEGEETVMTIAADHGVAFPMTELRTAIDFRRPFRDMALAGQNSA